MIVTYLIKSTLCLAVLFGFYKIALESKALHQFKRFYLLTSLIFSLTIPLVTFTYTTVEVPQDIWVEDFVQIPDQGVIPSSPLPIIEGQTNYLPYILWGVYGVGFLFFGGRFMLNLLRLKRKITQAETLEQPDFTLALLTQSIIPHSFLKYIFLSRKRYQNREIPSEVIAHEATHVRQKHSLDILFIEFLQVVFWFNPLFWITKKSITLNHEFLADQGAIKEEHDIYQYQHILLNYAGSTHHTTLESPFNYSSTKKRILMLSQSFSRKRLAISALLLIPIILGCLLVFNQGIIAEVNTDDLAIEGHWIDQKQERNPILISNESGLLSLKRGNSNNTTPITEESGAYFLENDKEGKQEIKIDPIDHTLVIGEQKYILPTESLKTQFSGLWENKEKLISFMIRNYEGTFTWVITEKGLEDEKMYFPNLTDTGFEFMRGDEWSSFTIKQGAIVDDKGNIYQRGKTPEDLSVKILGEDRYTINNLPATNASLMNVLESFNTNRTKEERQQIIIATIDEPTTEQADQVDMLYDTLHEYGVKGVSIYRGLTFPNTASENHLKEKHPTKQDLKRWLDTSQYGIWINQVSVSNEVLTAYTPSDLPYFTESTLEKNAANYGKHYVQVNLMTNTYWNEQGGTNDELLKVLQNKRSTEGVKEYKETDTKIYARSIDIEITTGGNYIIEELKITKNDLQNALASLHTDLTKGQRDRVINIHVSSQGDIPYEDLVFIQKVAANYGYHRIVTPKEEIVRAKGNVPAADDTSSKSKEAFSFGSTYQQTSNSYATEYVEGAERNGEKAFVIEIKNKSVRLNGKESSVATLRQDIDAITKDWEETDYTETYPSILVKNADKGFIEKLNKEFLKTQYSKANGGMDLIPPPPPAPPAPESQLPPPPPPPSVEDHLKSMNNIGGIFFYENKEVPFDKALRLVKTNKSLNVQTRHPYTNAPKTYISKEPIVVPNQKENTDPVTKKDIAVYNKLAKKYNKNPNGQILRSEVAFMYDIYNRMTEKQKKNAESYPALPPPPAPAPKAPKASKAPKPPKKTGGNELAVTQQLLGMETKQEQIESHQNQGGVFILNKKKVSKKDLLDFYTSGKEEFTRVRVDKKVKPIVMYVDNIPKEMVFTPITEKEIKEYNTLAKKYRNNPNGEIKKRELRTLYHVYVNMTEKQKATAEPYPAIAPPPIQNKKIGALLDTPATKAYKDRKEQVIKHAQQGGSFILNTEAATTEEVLNYIRIAKITTSRIDENSDSSILYVDSVPRSGVYAAITEEEVQKYNALAKKYTNNPNQKVKTKDRRKLYHVYVHMTKNQRMAAEPYPVLPPSKVSKNGGLVGVRGLSLEDRNSFNTSILDPSQKTIQEDARYYYNHRHISTAEAKELIANTPDIKQRTKPSKTFGQPIIFLYTSDLFEPSPRPTATNIIAHIKVSNRHQSQFYYGSEKITYEEALKLVRKNRSLQVITTINEQEQYQTKISKA